MCTFTIMLSSSWQYQYFLYGSVLDFCDSFAVCMIVVMFTLYRLHYMYTRTVMSMGSLYRKAAVDIRLTQTSHVMFSGTEHLAGNTLALSLLCFLPKFKSGNYQ